MKKNFRLKNNEEIGKIVFKRQKVSSHLYNIYFVFNQTETKIAVVAGKKCGGSIERNYQKRIIREVVRPRLAEINNTHAVIVAKDKVKETSFVEKKEVLNLMISKMIERKNNEKK